MRRFVLAAVVLGMLGSTGAATAAARPATVPLPPVFPHVVYGGCPWDSQVFGCYVEQTVYLDSPDRWALAHELGHAFDEEVMTDAQRWRFEVILGLHEDWWSDSWNPPAELFADAYAACRLRRTPWHGVWDTSYDYNPTPRQHRRVCALIRAASDERIDVRDDHVRSGDGSDGSVGI